jgi:predicted peroxiredoxin
MNHAENAVASSDSVRDGVFIHITESYNDPHRVLMPLKMALMMSDDKDVLVYMDIHAVELLVKGAKDMNFADFESAQSYINKLVDKKVGVYACPTCLKIAGFKPEDLMDGVQVAQKDKFFNFTSGRIVTLDY